MILGVDPGPDLCGWVLYNHHRIVIGSGSAAPLADVLEIVAGAARSRHRIAIERVQSTGQSGASLLRTSEVVGRLGQHALNHGAEATLVYRREVLRALDVTGKGNRDAMVRQRLIEMHGGDRKRAQGTKKAAGPLYSVSGHSWQALGVAIAALHGAGEVMR